MNQREELKEVLARVAEGSVSVEEAYDKLKQEPFVDLGFANIDLDRKRRKGASEVIYGAGKSAEQIADIVSAMKDAGQENVLITRVDAPKAEAVHILLEHKGLGWKYYGDGEIGVVGGCKEADGKGKIAVVTAGTSDRNVAEEAEVTARFLGNEVVRIRDVGVAGLHRLLAHLDELNEARVVIAIAGMEGALASVIGGLVKVPVIAVPTSVGYGASFGGVTALLAMLNSCASGVSVVNIDNGFGAAFQASMINHL